MREKRNLGMVDIGSKKITKRFARARSVVTMGSETMKVLCEKSSPKGDVFETARIAGIMAAKATSYLIPMCHPIEITQVSIGFKVDKRKRELVVISEVSSLGRTGVEMEALTAVSTAALTVYDMLKFSNKAIVISEIRLLQKSGGRSGKYKQRRA